MRVGLLDWLKRHGLQVLGAGLPIFVGVCFVFGEWFSGISVELPKYDALYLTRNTRMAESALDVDVRDGHIVFILKTEVRSWWVDVPKLYRYSAARRATSEVPLVIPYTPLNQPPALTIVKVPRVITPVPDLETAKIDTSFISPDGYLFDTRTTVTPWPGLIELLRFDPLRHAQNVTTLTKADHSIALPVPDVDIAFEKVTFIGWIVP
jgi:hypothetical protein